MQTLLHRSVAVLFALVIVAGFWHAAGGSRDDFDTERGITWLVPITYMKPAYEELAETFRQAHPDIPLRVIWVPGNEYQMKFKTLAAAGDAPDVLYTGDVWVAYMLPFLRPITDFVERDLEEIDLDDFY
ncbi:MAG: extracellular solute-binding protein, partial [Gemmatimonadetes bacterium]|nr:extracellular solute-binding protein [Gemmatimonadota bacterium]